MIFDCPFPYYFDSMILTAKYWDNKELKEKSFDLSDEFFVNTLPSSSDDPTPTTNKKHWTIRIPISNLNIVDSNGEVIPAIYKVDLVAKYWFKKVVGTSFTYGLPVPYNDTSVYEIRYDSGDYKGYVYQLDATDDNPEVDIYGKVIKGKIFDTCEEEGSDLEDSMICSDVNFVYRCMLDDVMGQADSRCAGISDEAIKKYLILYGHQAALAAGDEDTAEEYFRLLNNCFTNCGSNYRPDRHSNSCNCGRR